MARMSSGDTAPEAAEVQRAVHRRLGPARRAELAFEMSEEARRVSVAGLRARDPSLSAEEARARVLRQILGDALYAAAYCPDAP